MRKVQAYTLMEVMVTMVVITVVASLALPKYNTVVEKSRSAEGVQILTALCSAQQRYALEIGAGDTRNGSGGGNVLANGDLDVNIPGARYFPIGEIRILAVTAATASTAGTYQGLAEVANTQRRNGAVLLYTLRMDRDCDLECTNNLPYAFCQKIL
jgi:prepilin-type N-terminal cleavage/methylation domain-containing protein